MFARTKASGADLKALENAIILPGDDVTGAMHQTVMSLLAFIHHHSVEERLAEAETLGREIITWNGELYPESL